MKAKSIIAATAASIVLVCGGLIWITGGFSGNDRQLKAEAGQGPSAAAIPPPPKLPPPRSSASRSDLSIGFSEATNYRIFVERRGEDPKNGSYYFAQRALTTCSAVEVVSQMREREKSPEGKGRRAETAKKLSALCDGLAELKVTAWTVVDEGLKNGDVFLTAVGMPPEILASTRRQPSNMSGLLSLVNAADKPEILAAALEVAAFPHIFANLSAFGQPIKSMSPSEQASLATAFQLVWCDFGANCGPTNPEVLFMCDSVGQCVDAYEAMVREQYEAKRQLQPDWTAVERNRKRIVDAISKKADWLRPASQ